MTTARTLHVVLPPTPTSEAEQTRSADASRDKDAILNDVGALYREHFAFVWRSVRRLGVEPEAVDDIVQEVFVVVAKRPQAFRGRSKPRTWLFGIAMRVVGRYRRGAFRRRRKHAAFAEAAPPRADPYPQAEAAHTLLRLLDHVPRRQRAAYILSELEGFTGPEVAEVLDIRPRTAYAWIDASRRRLARALRRREEGDR